MAPVTKRAKKDNAKPAAAGGLQKFFGATKGPVAAATTTSGAETATEPVCKAAPLKPAGEEEPVKQASATVPKNETGTVPQTPAPAGRGDEAKPTGGLTDAQKLRIEENRRKALERKQTKGKVDAADKAPAPSPPAKGNSAMNATPSKSSGLDRPLKRSSSDITPEKVPQAERQKMPATPAAVAPATAQQAAPSLELEGDAKFRSFGKVPWMQFNNLYAARLEKLRGATLARAQTLWSTEVQPTHFLADIASKPPNSSGDIVVIGIVFKEMPSRDNIIDRYKNSTECGTLPEDDMEAQTSIRSESDVAWLEDPTFRIRVDFAPEQTAKLASGFVVAVRGRTTEAGTLCASSMCFPYGMSSISLPASSPKPDDSPAGEYLALLSGLRIGAPDEDVQARSRALDFLLGRSGTERSRSLSRALRHVIVCGDVYWTGKTGEVPPGLDDADKMFAELAEKLPTEVMPGHKDPSNWSLPQMPLHPFFFRTARNSSQFKSVSNPYQCTLEGVNVLGHSGQPVRDLLRCSSLSSPIDALTTCLDASLLAPTAPDSLGTQPFEKADPFVIEKAPQVLFSGGHSQAEYQYRAPEPGGAGTLCVCVPAFHANPSIVLINLSDPRDVCVQDFGPKAS